MGRMTGILLLAALLSGCGLGGSRLNPLNWFGGERAETVTVARAAEAPPVVDQVLSLTVDPTPSGAIVSAVGLPPTQGFWDAELVRVPSADPSVLVLDFRLLPPPERNPVGTQPSREVLAGRVLTRQNLAGVRTIAVQGARNRRSVSR